MRRRDTTRHSHAKLDRNPQDQYERENKNAFSLSFKIKLLLVLSSSGILQILIGTVGNRTTEQKERVQTETETRARAAAGRGRRAAVGAGGGVAGLSHLLVSGYRLRCIREKRGDDGGAYHSLQLPDVHAVEQFAGFVAVADILEGFC